MKYLIYILIFSLLPISCSAQKNSNQKSPNEFDQKLADSLGADKYGMKQYILSRIHIQMCIRDRNLISGAFPSSLLQLKMLQMLSLTGNQLSGDIPENIPALTFLDNNRYTKTDIKNFIVLDKKMADFTYSPQRYDEKKTCLLYTSRCV